jgi:hypothetical protein
MLPCRISIALSGLRFFGKIQKMDFTPKNEIKKLMVPSESAPHELSNEWLGHAYFIC